jgi:hypothetical protein
MASASASAASYDTDLIKLGMLDKLAGSAPEGGAARAVDRKTVRRYMAAAVACGVDRAGGEGQLGDELLGRVAELVRPHRAGGRGAGTAGRCRRRITTSSGP